MLIFSQICLPSFAIKNYPTVCTRSQRKTKTDPHRFKLSQKKISNCSLELFIVLFTLIGFQQVCRKNVMLETHLKLQIGRLDFEFYDW
jgi:hypothetical protein